MTQIGALLGLLEREWEGITFSKPKQMISPTKWPGFLETTFRKYQQQTWVLLTNWHNHHKHLLTTSPILRWKLRLHLLLLPLNQLEPALVPVEPLGCGNFDVEITELNGHVNGAIINEFTTSDGFPCFIAEGYHKRRDFGDIHFRDVPIHTCMRRHHGCGSHTPNYQDPVAATSEIARACSRNSIEFQQLVDI